MEAAYRAAQESDLSDPGYAVTLYDNIYKGYSPAGKNTVNIIVFQGYDHLKPFESDYFSGNKSAYREEKERMADILIEKVDTTLLPGLADVIEVKEIGTPLTNVRYTSNYRGANYGWDQTVDNSGQSRLGHGYGSVLSSGLECFGEIMQKW